MLAESTFDGRYAAHACPEITVQEHLNSERHEMDIERV